jgi:hypothetical protein
MEIWISGCKKYLIQPILKYIKCNDQYPPPAI